MSCEWDIIGREGFQFFGKVCGSVTHEIKNVLAIINENAGLLEDFTLMAEKGVPIDPDRLSKLSAEIMKQIRRADLIVKNMNVFAHSVDDPVKTLELSELFEVVNRLSARFILMRGATVDPIPASGPVMITTSPFLLQNLIWLCLDFAISVAGAKKSVSALVEETETGGQIRFARLEELGKVSTGLFPSSREGALMSALKADVEMDVERGEFLLALPRDIAQS